MNSNNVVIVLVPEMTTDKYAEHVGVSDRTVDGWVNKGLIPTVKIGRRRLVDVASIVANRINLTTPDTGE